MTDITITPIGILHCDLQLRRETPRNYDISSEEGIIELYPRYIQGLDGIRAGDDILVLFWFNQARRDILRVHPRGDTNRPIRGVFATRSPVRPNPIALSQMRVLAIEQNLITVRRFRRHGQDPGSGYQNDHV